MGDKRTFGQVVEEVWGLIAFSDLNHLAEIAEELDESRDRVRRALKRLEDEGRIEANGFYRDGSRGRPPVTYKAVQ